MDAGQSARGGSAGGPRPALPRSATRIELCDRIDAAALDRCIAGPDRDSRRGGFGRLDVTSAFTPEDERVYTTSDVFAAETRLLAAHDPLVTTGR